MNKIKIIIADDHPVFRSGLKWEISEDSKIEIVGEAENGEEALEIIREYEPDVAILDVDMPKMTGFDVARKLQTLDLATEIIILTIHNDEGMFNKAMDLGVKGYLLKESAIDDIANGIKLVAKGKSFIHPDLTEYLFNRSNSEISHEKQNINSLTPTQFRVLRLIAKEKTSREIAEMLFISYRTVERHRENICLKLNLKGSNVLLKYALANKENLL